jgi:hypothetical protein
MERDLGNYKKNMLCFFYDMECDENVRVKWVSPRKKMKMCMQKINYLGETMKMC